MRKEVGFIFINFLRKENEMKEILIRICRTFPLAVLFNLTLYTVISSRRNACSSCSILNDSRWIDAGLSWHVDALKKVLICERYQIPKMIHRKLRMHDLAFIILHFFAHFHSMNNNIDVFQDVIERKSVTFGLLNISNCEIGILGDFQRETTWIVDLCGEIWFQAKWRFN